MMIQGVPPQKLAADFAKKMQSKKFDAYRLLHAESSFLMSEATHAGYVEDGVEKYQILATLDSKTCGICGDLDGKVYKTDEAVTGVNMPPFHCFCRCTNVPYYDDTDLSDQTRAARDADGNPIEVPADMTYAEWKKEYLDHDANILLTQEYKKVIRGNEKAIVVEKMGEIKLREVKTYNGDVYISDKANIKPKALHEIHQNTVEAMKAYGIPMDRKPEIRIVDYSELGALGRYDAINNTVYYLPEITDINISGGKSNVEHHEIWHMKQAEQYRNSGHKITKDTYGEYIEKLCAKCGLA
jgi:SPP1 gp7 family putative phage head morphogenesis protein